MVCRLRSAAAVCTAGDTPCAENTRTEFLGYLVGLVDEDDAAFGERVHDVPVCTISLRT